MNDDELRQRLQAADPARTGAPADSWIPDLVEATMSNPNETEQQPRQTWLPLAAAAALVLVLGGAYLLLGTSDDDGDKAAKKPTSVSLSLPNSDPATAMCIAFDVETLKQAPMAFSGTVESVEDGDVTLDVDHWYKGGDADQVVLKNEGAAANVALDGVDFTDGERYLVSAGEGTVSTCGYSGPWSEDFAAQFDQAFGS